MAIVKNVWKEMIALIPFALIANSGDFILSFFDIEKASNPMYGYIKWGIVIGGYIIYGIICVKKLRKK